MHSLHFHWTFTTHPKHALCTLLFCTVNCRKSLIGLGVYDFYASLFLQCKNTFYPLESIRLWIRTETLVDYSTRYSRTNENYTISISFNWIPIIHWNKSAVSNHMVNVTHTRTPTKQEITQWRWNFHDQSQNRLAGSLSIRPKEGKPEEAVSRMFHSWCFPSISG